MFTLKRLLFVLLTLFFSLILSSCSGDDGGSGGGDNGGNTQYTVSFYDDGTVIPELTRTVTGGAQITLPVRTKIGYTFDGWLLSGAGSPLTNTYTVNANTIFVAKWTADNPGVTEYTVSFYDDGNIIPELGLTVEGGTQINLPSHTKADYTFDGWLLSGVGIPYINNYTVTADTVFVAKWTADNPGVTEYTVSFYDDGTVIPGLTMTVESGTQISLPYHGKTGYSFDGWLLDGIGTPFINNYTVTANTVFVAKWTADTPVMEYTVSFYDDENLIPELSLTVESGTQITLPSYAKLGYTLDGWLLGGIGGPLTATYTVTANTVFIAKWTTDTSITKYTVSFYDNGVIVPEFTQTVASGTQIIVPSRTKTGYSFGGWLLNGTGTPFRNTYTVNSDAVFIAKWTANLNDMYTVFYYDNGIVIPELSVMAAKGMQITLPELTKTGYTFEGWLVSFDDLFASTINSSINETYTVTDTVYFHAKFTAAGYMQYTVSYYDEAGYKYPDIGGTVNNGDTITMPTRTRRGYTFDGWLEGGEGSPINETYAVTSDVSFHARFTLPDAVLITTAEELYEIRRNRSGKYMLGNDISLAVYGSGSGWEPIYFFTGILDGNGFKIADLYVDNNTAGLFESIEGGAAINNLTIEISTAGIKGTSYAGALAGRINGTSENRVIISNVRIEGAGDISSSSYSGGVAGRVSGMVTIMNCYNTADVSSSSSNSSSYSGGIVGNVSHDAIISNCYNTGMVSSVSSSLSSFSSSSGGIVGYVYSATIVTIINCYNTGNISSSVSGGIAGSGDSITIRNCYNTGNISSTSRSGGIVGYASVSTITNCHNTGEISSSSYSGGIAGYASSSTIIDCYNSSNISSSYSSGGIIGQVGGDSTTITNCYNTGNISSLSISSSSSSSSYTNSYSGGIAGEVSGIATITNCYNIGNISSSSSSSFPSMPLSYSGGIAGEVSGIATITKCYNAGDISSSSSSLSSYFSSYSYSGGIIGQVGASSDSTTITDCYNTGNISSSSSYSPSSSSPYSSSSSYSGGIVGNVSHDAIISNCYNTGMVSSVSSSLSSFSSSSGGIVGYVYSATIVTIINCYNIGNVSSFRYSGGIVGDARGIVTIMNCYNTGNISSSVSGGIAGYGDSITIRNCYNTGNISSTSRSGGIVGSIGTNDEVMITNCYNIGDIFSYNSDSSYSGGIVGVAYWSSSSLYLTISNNAAINAVIEVDASSTFKFLGRIIGRLSGSNLTVNNNFALNTMIAVGGSFNTSDTASHGTSKTDAQLRTRSTYENAIIGNGLGGLGWLFGNDDEHPWKMPSGGTGYPILYWQE